MHLARLNGLSIFAKVAKMKQVQIYNCLKVLEIKKVEVEEVGAKRTKESENDGEIGRFLKAIELDQDEEMDDEQKEVDALVTQMQV